MPKTDLGQEPEELGVVYGCGVSFDSRGVYDGSTVVVTEDGRALRITGARYLGEYCERFEITVAEEGA